MLLHLPANRHVAWATLSLLAALTLHKLIPWHDSTAHDSRTSAIGEVCIVAPATPFDPKWGIGLYDPRAVPDDARCPVCGMYPARAREWAAQVIFSNGDTQFFDSALSLFIYLQDPAKYSIGRRTSEIAVSYVTDTASGKWIKSTEALFVSGSNAMGPMRAGNLPAFASAEAAREFADQRGGIILQANQISPSMLQKLNGSRRHVHVTTTAPAIRH